MVAFVSPPGSDDGVPDVEFAVAFAALELDAVVVSTEGLGSELVASVVLAPLFEEAPLLEEALVLQPAASTSAISFAWVEVELPSMSPR